MAWCDTHSTHWCSLDCVYFWHVVFYAWCILACSFCLFVLCVMYVMSCCWMWTPGRVTAALVAANGDPSYATIPLWLDECYVSTQTCDSPIQLSETDEFQSLKSADLGFFKATHTKRWVKHATQLKWLNIQYIQHVISYHFMIWTLFRGWMWTQQIQFIFKSLSLQEIFTIPSLSVRMCLWVWCTRSRF